MPGLLNPRRTADPSQPSTLDPLIFSTIHSSYTSEPSEISMIANSSEKDDPTASAIFPFLDERHLPPYQSTQILNACQSRPSHPMSSASLPASKFDLLSGSPPIEQEAREESTREVRQKAEDHKRQDEFGKGNGRGPELCFDLLSQHADAEAIGWYRNNAQSSSDPSVSAFHSLQRWHSGHLKQKLPTTSEAVLDQKGLGQIEEHEEQRRFENTKRRAPSLKEKAILSYEEDVILLERKGNTRRLDEKPSREASLLVFGQRRLGHQIERGHEEPQPCENSARRAQSDVPTKGNIVLSHDEDVVLWGKLAKAQISEETPRTQTCQIRGASTAPPSLDSRILSRLAATLQDEKLYRRLLSCRESDAQRVVDIFQLLLDTRDLAEDFRNQLITAIRRLSERTELYPSCFNIQNPVRVLDNHPSDSGSYSDIYQAQLYSKRLCLKVVRTYKTSLMKQIAKVYAREAIVWGQISHPSILPFYGLCSFQSRIAFVSPWAENGHVLAYLARNPQANRILLCLDTAAGLNYLHNKSIVHGDVKAANILVDVSGRACLTDFGLSSVKDPQILHWTSHFPAASNGGSIRWQAPELIAPDSDDVQPANFTYNSKASDIFAWACLCYEVFTGLLPFSECARESTVILKISRGDHPTKPADGTTPWTEGGLSMSVWSIMEDCWKFQPQDRPHVSEVASQLALGAPLDTRPPSQWQSRSAVEFRNMQRAYSNCHSPTLEELDAILR